jgi:hypothetical protein
VGDRNGGRLEARVPEIVLDAHGDRIVAAIWIIAPVRGFQRHGEGILAVHEGQAGARLDLTILIRDLIRAGLHPGAVGPIGDGPRHGDCDQSPVGRRQRRGAGGGNDGRDRIYLSGVARKPWNLSLVGSKTHPTSWPTTLIPWR